MHTAVIIFVCGIGSFILGLRTISFSFSYLFGTRIQQRLTAVTNYRIWQIFSVSAVFTGLVQSSSAVTVIGVCLVNSGVFTITDALALTLGANIGTTVTTQLISLPLRESITWMLVVGLLAAAYSVIKRSRRRQLLFASLAVCGLGLLLTGFELLQTSLKTLAHLPSFRVALKWMSGGDLKSFTGGMLATAVIQSSSVVIASIISLIRQGEFSLDVALYAMLGSNVGTSATTLLAMVGGTRAGKAAAISNLAFNIISVMLILPFMGLLRLLAVATSLDVGRQIANAHTIFNVVTALVVLPFVPRLAKAMAQIIDVIHPRKD